MMDKAYFYELKICKLKNKQSVFILCDGYDGWNWGVPLSPIYFDYSEYSKIKNFLMNRFNYDLVNDIIQGTGRDCILPKNIVEFLGKKVCTFETMNNKIPTENDWDNYLFKTKEEKRKAVKEKEELLHKLSLLDDEMTSHK